MNTKRTIYLIVAISLFALMVSACSGAAPTTSPTQVQNLVNTAVAQTAQANVCTGYYGNMAFNVPAGTTVNYPQPKGESVDITCYPNGDGMKAVQKHADGTPYTSDEIAKLLATATAASTTVPPTLQPTTSAPANTGAGTGFCPDRKWVNDNLFGVGTDRVVSVSTEDGAWQINTGDPKFFYPVTLPANVGLIATIHRPWTDLAEVYVGDGSTHKAFRGTFRFAGCYSATDDMNQPDAAIRILFKENQDGRYQNWANGMRLENWQFSIIPGNFACPTGIICPSANTTDNSASNRSSALPTNCPQFAGNSTTPGNDGAAFCKYKGSVVTGTVPTGWKAEFWNGSSVVYANQGDSIKTGEVTFRPLP